MSIEPQHIYWIQGYNFQRTLAKHDRKCGIGISLIFWLIFWYLPIFLTVLGYLVPPRPSLPLKVTGHHAHHSWEKSLVVSLY